MFYLFIDLLFLVLLLYTFLKPKKVMTSIFGTEDWKKGRLILRTISLIGIYAIIVKLLQVLL